MPQKLTDFVTPITEPLSGMQGHFTQLSSSLRTMNRQLQNQVDLLTGNAGNSAFQGLGATTFTNTIEHYLTLSNKHSSTLEQASTLTQTCNLQLFNAVTTANGNNPNSIIVNHVLNKVTINQIVEQGSTPVEGVLQEIRKTLDNMTASMDKYGKDMQQAGQSFGQAWNDLVHGNFGASGHDFQQSWNDFSQTWPDLGQFLLDCGLIMWQSVFEMTWAALVQCAEDIWQALQSLAQDIRNLVATDINDIQKDMAATWEYIKDEATFDYDMARGDYTDALLALIAADINPILIEEGLQPLSQSQIQEMLPPSFWQWFKNLPGWAKITIGAVVAIIIIGLLLWGGSSGGNTDQQRKITRIRNRLSADGITVKDSQIEELLKAGYTEDQVYYILKAANLDKSADMYITAYDGHKVYGHTLSSHVNISNTDLRKRALTDQRLRSSFKDQKTAQNAVNYTIANSPILQEFIKNGAAGSTASDTKCYHTTPPPNLGYGYEPVPPLPSKKVVKVGPLHCMHITLGKTILGIIFILTSYPVPG